MFTRHWLNSELSALKKHYPVGGAEKCATTLPGRTIGAIHRMAWRNGINAPHSMEILRMRSKQGVTDVKEDESEKLEAERQRIQQEEEAKDEAKVRAEQEAKAEAESTVAENKAADEAKHATPAEPAAVAEPVQIAQTQNQSAPIAQSTRRPSDEKIIAVLCLHFGVSEQTVRGWLIDMNLRGASQLLAQRTA